MQGADGAAFRRAPAIRSEAGEIMGALEERGLQVPSDIAVIGFDDIEEARFSTPPLTTIRQPLYQQGEAALDLVLAQLEGHEVALRASAPGNLDPEFFN